MSLYTIYLIIFFVGIITGFGCGISIALMHSGAKEDLIRENEMLRKRLLGVNYKSDDIHF